MTYGHQKTQVRLTDCISPAFYDLHQDIKSSGHTYYRLPGGRGSTKSSFISIEIILGIMADASKGIMSNAVCFRRYKDNLHESVYAQIEWALDKLEVSHLWHCTLSPLRMTYKPTGQTILFRGADKATKAKSIKVAKGWIKYVWFEELDEFEGSEKVRSIQQSVVRGGPQFVVFFSYNPPRSMRNWVNDPVQWQRADTLTVESTYLVVPREWLGEQFIIDAEHLRDTKPERYEHEYLGVVTGTGAEVFSNLTARVITAEEIAQFDRIKRGLDWGYAADPLHYTVNHYDKTRKRLYIFFEIHQVKLSNRKATERIKAENINNQEVLADSAEPKSIDECREYGLCIRGAPKPQGSVEHGTKWLSEELEEIVIDPTRCPNTWREFYGYELDVDANGNFKAGYPDKDNHSIDSVRYSRVEDMKAKTSGVVQIRR